MDLGENYYRELLSSQGKVIYDYLLMNIGKLAIKGSTTFTIRATEQTLQEAVEAYFALRDDRPEFFFLGNTVKASYESSGWLTIKFNKRFNEDQIKRINRLLKRYIHNLVDKVKNRSVLEREEFIYRSVGREFTYKNGVYSNDLSGLLVFHEGVCQSIAGILTIALRESRIPAIVVDGNIQEELHRWNKVWINEAEYFLDVTWDMDNCKHNKSLKFFNLNYNQMSFEHSRIR